MTRRRPVVPPEGPDKAVGIGKTAALRHLCHGKRGMQQQLLGAGDAVAHHILLGAAADPFPEAVGKIAGAQKIFLCQGGYVDFLRKMPLNITADFKDGMVDRALGQREPRAMQPVAEDEQLCEQCGAVKAAHFIRRSRGSVFCQQPRAKHLCLLGHGGQVKYGAEAVGTVDEYGAELGLRQQMFQVLGGKLGEVAAVGLGTHRQAVLLKLVEKDQRAWSGGVVFLLNMNLYGSGLYINHFIDIVKVL